MEKITIKKKDVFELLKTIEEIMSEEIPFKLSYALVKNRNYLEKKLLEFKVNMPSIPKEFLVEQMKLISKYSKKDENGNIIFIDEKAGIPNIENREEAEKELQGLKEKYKDSIVKYEEEHKKFEETLNEEIEVEVYKIPLAFFPDNISKKYAESLYLLITG